MKKEVHPTVYKDAKTSCQTCSTVFLIPSTVKEQSVEVCRMCHPIYTGKVQKEARGGRVERFRKMQAATSTKKSK